MSWVSGLQVNLFFFFFFFFFISLTVSSQELTNQKMTLPELEEEVSSLVKISYELRMLGK